MMNTKLWLIVAAAIALLLVAVFALNRTPTPTTAPAVNESQADAEHNAFMIDGGKNDKGTGKSFKLGDGSPETHPKNPK